MEELNAHLEAMYVSFIASLSSWEFYAQLGFVLGAVTLAYVASSLCRAQLPFFKNEPSAGLLLEIRSVIHKSQVLLFPIFLAILLGIATQASLDAVSKNWIVRICQGLSVILILYHFVHNFIKSQAVVRIATWIGGPIAILYVLGLLDDVTRYLDGISLEVGDIKITAYALVRTIVFGIILFWLGRVSQNTGKRVIRNQPSWDVGTREVVSKLFEIALYVVIFLLLLQVMGISLTAFAVFGGAVGVGLGFGLQQIAANFISGIIILLDRSILPGDFIQLEDGRAGYLRELNMRSAILETFDGKDIMVPNEKFITTAFTNWTHNNQKQRYSLNFSVAYDTDLEKMFPIVRDIVASHPSVLSGDDLPLSERPDAEIQEFADSGIVILVEFWMEHIDDGDYRVGADLLMMIWTALKENGITIPFPQREVKILNKD